MRFEIASLISSGPKFPLIRPQGLSMRGGIQHLKLAGSCFTSLRCFVVQILCILCVLW